MSRDILIRSLSRTSGSTSSSDFTIQFFQRLALDTRRKLKLKYFMLYNTVYNITTSNQNIDFNENSTNKTCAIPVGIWDAVSLATQVGTSMTTASSGYNTFTCTYSLTTKKFTISAGNNFSLLFSTGSNASTSMWEPLGFASSNGLSGTNTTAATSTTGTQVSNLSLPLSLCILISNLTAPNVTSDGSMYSFYLPLSSSGGGIIEYFENSYFEQEIDIPMNFTQLDRLNILLVSANNTSVNLNGSEWEMILSLV